MTTFEILVAIYMAVVPPALGALFWARLNRLETRIDTVSDTLRSEIAAARDEFRAEMSAIRTEIAAMRDESRADIASLRSDLTQIALAVGTRPRASEA